MNSSSTPHVHFPRQLVYGLVALIVSITIAVLINRGLVEPYPNMKAAYLICTAVGVSGLIQTIRGLIDLKKV